MENLLDRAWEKCVEFAIRARSEKGQNTVEYLMMMGVIVGFILLIGKMFKPHISAIFNQVMGMISGAVNTVGQ